MILAAFSFSNFCASSVNFPFKTVVVTEMEEEGATEFEHAVVAVEEVIAETVDDEEDEEDRFFFSATGSGFGFPAAERATIFEDIFFL